MSSRFPTFRAETSGEEQGRPVLSVDEANGRPVLSADGARGRSVLFVDAASSRPAAEGQAAVQCCLRTRQSANRCYPRMGEEADRPTGRRCEPRQQTTGSVDPARPLLPVPTIPSSFHLTSRWLIFILPIYIFHAHLRHFRQRNQATTISARCCLRPGPRLRLVLSARWGRTNHPARRSVPMAQRLRKDGWSISADSGCLLASFRYSTDSQLA